MNDLPLRNDVRHEALIPREREVSRCGMTTLKLRDHFIDHETGKPTTVSVHASFFTSEVPDLVADLIMNMTKTERQVLANRLKADKAAGREMWADR
jgi:hypothetical protein